ncbi:hypothetical protein [Actibacterium sp. MT2.3-13A]|uniref:hypothetical protein n=1 Tax=Actibacterium sp. MT2.3-13A TaxID=2828332 RepID=UPI001BA55EB1|nr:hypothetical protein [Actibacterium sp. MT2.3-13A]
MLRFLFGMRPRAEASVAETQREELERLIRELNAAVAALPEKPRLIIDPASGKLELDLPETLPDEALALPAPERTEQDDKPVSGDEAA